MYSNWELLAYVEGDEEGEEETCNCLEGEFHSIKTAGQVCYIYTLTQPLSARYWVGDFFNRVGLNWQPWH